MINAGMIRTENVSNTQSGIKSALSEQKLPRMKSKALGDVQNTLHSRQVNFGNAITNSAVKASSKAKHSLVSSGKKSSERKINVTPSKSALKPLLTTPSIEREIYEIHHHILCEEDEQSHLNDFFSEYKFSEEQIKNLVRSVKISASPLLVPSYEPCEDLIMPRMEKYDGNNLSLSDIFNDVNIPEVPPL